MSFALRLVTWGLRTLVKPRLGRMDDPLRARRLFEQVMRLTTRTPPYLLTRAVPGALWVSGGAAPSRRVLLYLHGGGYFAGSPQTHLGLVARLAGRAGMRALVPDYRLAPEDPAPAALEDCRAAHALLLDAGHAPGDIVLAGDSAGGGLATALLSELCARGQSPAGVVLFSPWTDLTLSGVSLTSNALADPLLPAAKLPQVIETVRGNLAPSDPRLSPLFARFDAPPPVLIQVGSTEILRDDSLRLAGQLRRAGGTVTLRQWQDVPHAWQIMAGRLPEADQALDEAAAFLRAL